MQLRVVAPRAPILNDLLRTADLDVVTALRRGTFLACAALAMLLVAATGVYLSRAQDAARRKLRHDFAARAALAAGLTAGVFQSNTAANVAYARGTYGGDEKSIQPAADADLKTDPGERVFVLAADGRLLGAAPRSLATQAASLVREPEVERALAGRLGYSDVVSTGDGPAVMMAVPFPTRSGRRVWAVSVALAQLLTSSLGVASGTAVLVDANGIVIATSARQAIGTRLRDRVLLAAAARVRSGTVGGADYASTRVSGTPWRVVFTVPTGALLAPLRSTRRLAWQLFGAFVLAIIGMLVLAARAVQASEKLAHQRMHDGLTGLPNRTLFIRHAEQALADVRARGGRLAALFIDLDRFKPINDEHGHAIGDAVLATVAQRLNAAVRTGDVVGRFGGDEFLVLCGRLADEQQGLEIAQRIQQALTVPYVIGRIELTVGCSIGVAYYSGDAPSIDADGLIHYADLAMYEAKKHGRARIETAPRLAVAT